MRRRLWWCLALVVLAWLVWMPVAVMLGVPLTGAASVGSSGSLENVRRSPSSVASSPVVGETAFVCFALAYARAAAASIRAPSGMSWDVAVVLAQWGVEQGWQVPGYTGYNWGSVAALPGYPSVPGTSAPGSPASFAFAATPEQGVAEYVAVADNGRYEAVGAASPAGPDVQARALGASPWDAAHYTADGSPGDVLVAAMERYNLYRFDNGSATC